MPSVFARNFGRSFEARVAYYAQLEQMLLVHHGVQTRYARGGKTFSVRSDLDFRLSNRQGQTVFFDAKSRAEDYFTYSELTAHQMQRALLYASYNLVAGFLFEFRSSGVVSFFDAPFIRAQGPRTRFTCEQGVICGTRAGVRLRELFRLCQNPRHAGLNQGV